MALRLCNSQPSGRRLAIGIGAGVALGVAMNNLALGIAIGTLLGLLSVARPRDRRQNRFP